MAAGPDPSLAGLRFVITAGGTREPIDPVRYIGNRSSGKMGNALAAAALAEGAEVTLVTAGIGAARTARLDGVALSRPPTRCTRRCANTLAGARVLIMAAAVADWRPSQAASHKLKKGAATRSPSS